MTKRRRISRNSEPTTAGLPKYRCMKCGHSWIPRIANPESCPACGSRKWRRA